MRRTKILATLGPASAKPEVLEKMIEAGLDAVRLNFSHGSHAEHAATYELVREAARKAKKPVAILQDLQGPKIRIGKVKGGSMEVPTGSTLIVTSRPIEGEAGVVSTEYEALARDVPVGERILLDEGRLEIRVREVREREGFGELVCDVVDGGTLSSKKGISVPGATLTADAMTDKDREDVAFGLSLGVDLVALSFVRRASDVLALRRLMDERGRRVPIVAKIEKPQAMDALEEIIAACEGVMVARGDLGVEVSLEMVPAYQKRIIERANHRGKLVITATQMLESMTENPRPTRAEVTDVANAILDGSDAVMLSGETAVGKYPVETVSRMSKIAEATERTLYPFDKRVRTTPDPPASGIDFASAVAHSAARASSEVGAKSIVVFTGTGHTAALLSDERPSAPVVAFAADPAILRSLALYWGVVALPMPEADTLEELETRAAGALAERRLASKGDVLVFAFGDLEEGCFRGTRNSVRIARAPG